MSLPDTYFDAIVIGSGITGGWAAKELTERGLRVLMIERGPMIEHQTGYTTETLAPSELPFRGYGNAQEVASDYAIQSRGRFFNEWTAAHFVNDRENPYQTDPAFPFQWRRGYQLGGRSLLWGRQCYRWGDIDLGANARDGHGTDWPIRYADLAPWYDQVEDFIGVSGHTDGLPQLPDGHFQKPMEMNAVEKALRVKLEARWPTRRMIIGRTANITEEKPGRSPCQYRSICARGCSYGAYFSTQSSTLPAANATGRLTLMIDTLVEKILYDPKTKRATGVTVIDTKTGARGRHDTKLVFLCAGSVNSISVLLRSASADMPNGLGNTSGTLGQYFMDHAQTVSVIAKVPGFEGRTYFGNRPNGILIPRFVNVTEQEPDLLRGYTYQGLAFRNNWPRGETKAGLGADFKRNLRHPGDWLIALAVFAECLPDARNRVTLDAHATDRFGLPQTRIELQHRENERKLLAHANKNAHEMVALLGAEIITSSAEPGLGGTAVHEMGGARMGRDPKTSVLNGFSQTHDVANLFITDGAAMASTASQNPSLTYMALTARAAAHAVSMLREGVL